MDIQFAKAEQLDARRLALVSQQAFDHDVHYGAPAAGGPPGYRSANWHLRMILTADFYKIVAGNGRIIGGIVVYQTGYRQMELGRIFLHPTFQNQGIGEQAICFLEQTYPETDRWTLDTPAWNQRNRHFYEKMGYRLTGKEGPGGLWFAKQMTKERDHAVRN